MYGNVVACLGTQAGVGDGGLQDSGAEWRLVGGQLAASVPELLVDARVLTHVGGQGAVKDQAQDDNEE